MKFTCSKQLLNEAVNNILPAVAQKSSIPSLEGVLLTLKRGNLVLTAYNLELGISKELSVNSFEDGEIVLNAALFSNILNKMPDGELSFSTDEKLLTLIKCQNVDFTILGLSCEEYPEMPTIEKEKNIIIDRESLKDMISQTLFAISQNDQNPVLCGSLFDIQGDMLNVVSVDGVRLALRSEKVKCDSEIAFVVPGKTLSEILRLLSRIPFEDDEKDVTLSVTNKHILLNLNGYSIISRLLEGSFLDYGSAIPEGSKTEVLIDTKEFLDCINRASIIINERAKSPIQCTFEDGVVKVFCETSIGKINDRLNADIKGDSLKIGFNNRYMADALKASECSKLLLQFNGPVSPIKIKAPDSDDFLFLVLPVRLKS